jgi:mercuric ion binding protein
MFNVAVVRPDVKLDFATKRAGVVFDPKQATVDALTKATTDAGYPSYLERVK